MQAWSQWITICVFNAPRPRVPRVCMSNPYDRTYVRMYMTSFIGFTHEWGQWQLATGNRINYITWKNFALWLWRVCVCMCTHGGMAPGDVSETQKKINLFAVNAKISENDVHLWFIELFDQSVFISMARWFTGNSSNNSCHHWWRLPPGPHKKKTIFAFHSQFALRFRGDMAMATGHDDNASHVERSTFFRRRKNFCRPMLSHEEFFGVFLAAFHGAFNGDGSRWTALEFAEAIFCNILIWQFNEFHLTHEQINFDLMFALPLRRTRMSFALFCVKRNSIHQMASMPCLDRAKFIKAANALDQRCDRCMIYTTPNARDESITGLP